MAKRRTYKRDRDGKFARTGGGGRRNLVVGPKSYLGAYAKRKETAAKPLGSSRGGQAVAGALVGFHASRGAQISLGAATASAAFASRGNYAIAAAAAAKAGTSAASAANEVHRINTITSKKFQGRSVEEKSKFHKSAAKREKVINRLDNAADLALQLGVIAGAAGPIIKSQAGLRNQRRRFSDNRGLPAKASTGPKATRQGRNGVYNISDVKGRRVQ